MLLFLSNNLLGRSSNRCRGHWDNGNNGNNGGARDRSRDLGRLDLVGLDHKLDRHRQLGRGQAQGLLGVLATDAASTNLKDDAVDADTGGEVIHRSLTLTHTGLTTFGSDGDVREDSGPDL